MKKRQWGWRQARASLLSFRTLTEEGGLVYPSVEGREFQIITSTAFLTR